MLYLWQNYNLYTFKIFFLIALCKTDLTAEYYSLSKKLKIYNL
jgi:hypothetical protein